MTGKKSPLAKILEAIVNRRNAYLVVTRIQPLVQSRGGGFSHLSDEFKRVEHFGSEFYLASPAAVPTQDFGFGCFHGGNLSPKSHLSQ
jgi:hypothetical protein